MDLPIRTYVDIFINVCNKVLSSISSLSSLKKKESSYWIHFGVKYMPCIHQFFFVYLFILFGTYRGSTMGKLKACRHSLPANLWSVWFLVTKQKFIILLFEISYKNKSVSPTLRKVVARWSVITHECSNTGTLHASDNLCVTLGRRWEHAFICKFRRLMWPLHCIYH